MARKVTIKEFTSGKLVLDTEYIRVSNNSERLAITIDGEFNMDANKLERNVLYVITLSEENAELMTIYGKFVSYSYLNSISAVDKTKFVTTDNTILFETIR